MRRLHAWLLAVVVVTVVVSIGLPLVGSRVLLATDNLFLHAPWAEEAPADLRPTNPLMADTVDAVTPRRVEFARRLRDGDLPLWTSLPASGVPLAAQTNGGLASPLNVAWIALPARYAPAATKVIEVVVAVGFTFLFLRRIGLGRAAAGLGGFVYAFSAFQVVWTNWPQATVGATIPALLWAVERAVDRRGTGPVAVVALVTAVLVLGGFPAVAAYALLAAGGYALVRVLADPARPLRRRARSLMALAGAVLLGVALSAFQLLPFLQRLGSVQLGYRQQTGASHLPLPALATTVVPDAFGSPVDRVGMAGVPGAPVNYVEFQSFVGATTMVLLVLAALRWRPRRLPRGVWTYLWASLGVMVALMYLGGPPLELLQQLPGTRPIFGINNVGRMRSVMGLVVAVLAAGGYQTLVSGGERRRPRPAALAVGGVAGVAGAVLAVRVVGLTVRTGLGAYAARQAALPLTVAVLAVGAVVLGRRVRLAGSTLAVWALPALFAVEVLAFTLPLWPRVPLDQFYPTTPAHRFLQQHLGHDRMAAEHRTLYPGTTSYYGLRSVTAHTFQPPAWAELLTAVDEHAFDEGFDTPPVRSDTFPHLRGHPDVIGSPVLDRLGVRYFAVAPHIPVLGIAEPATVAATGTVTLDAGGTAEVAVPRTDLRGVVLRLAEPFGGTSGIARLRVELLDEGGRLLGGGRRRVYPTDPPVRLLAGGEPFATGVTGPFSGDGPGPFPVALTEPPWDPSRPDRPGTVRLTFEDLGGRLVLAGTAAGEPVVQLLTPGDDGLRVAFSDGTVIYERTTALPRLRWVGRAEVVDDPAERLARAAAPDARAAVLLSDPGPPGSGAAAALQVLEDSGDAIVVDVAAEGDGYLVVADSLAGWGWHATVDGAAAELRTADHALAAVHVPPGEHRVELRYQPRLWRLGLAVSGLAAVAVVVLAVVASRRRRTIHPLGAPDRDRTTVATPGGEP